MKLVLDNDQILCDDCCVANTFFQKLRGKLFIKKPLVLMNCNSIHTIFLRKKIDVVFLDKNNTIIKIYQNLLPRCIIFPIISAKYAIEFDAGFLDNVKIKLGQKILFE